MTENLIKIYLEKPNKKKKKSEIGQDQKTLIPVFV